MSVRTLCAASAALVVASCGSPPAPAPEPLSTTASVAAGINPARISQVRRDLPPGYEIGALDPGATPLSLWGLGTDWSADPPQCAALAAPPVDASTARGWSASGPGGIVYAGVARMAAPADPALGGQCVEWSVTGGRTTGVVHILDAPAIDATVTAGMSADLVTVVEGGSETHTHTDTFTADVADYHCFVTLVTDPGSPNPPLGADGAADLLRKAVSALRG